MKIIVACAVAALLTGCALPPPAGPGTAAVVRDAEDPALARVLADYEAYLREVDPVSAGMEGDKAAMSRLPDGSRAFEVAQEPALKAFADRLAAIDAARLSPTDALNHAFMAMWCSVRATESGWIQGGWTRSTPKAGRDRQRPTLRASRAL
jgi:hypothetical protein